MSETTAQSPKPGRPGSKRVAPAEGDAAALARVNRTLRMVNDSNQALIHATGEGQLLDDICRIAVTVGGYRLAWAGYAEQDAAHSVRPVAIGGPHADYVNAAQVSWADNPQGRGPTGTCIREGRTVVARDFVTDPHMAPWRASAAKAGFRSSMAIPLRDDGVVFGALTIYSAEPDAFDEREAAILGELAGDLGYGVTALRTRVAQAQAEAEARQGERRYRSLVEALNDGLVEVDGEYRVTFVNAHLARMVGREPSALVGRSVFEVLDPAATAVVRRQAWRPGAPLTERYELTLLSPSGSRVPALVSVHRRCDAAGRFLGSLSVVTDLSELKALRAAREDLASIVENAQDGIVSEDLAGVVTSWNKGAEQIYGYTATEMIGRTAAVLEPAERKGEMADLVARVVRGEPVARLETERMNKAGGRLIISLTISPVRDFTGQIVGVSRIFRDITESRRVEQELARHRQHLEEMVEARTAELAAANQELEAFAYSVSHDLRAPLRAVDGFSEILLEDYGPKLDAEGQHVVTVIRESAQKMGRMIDDILAFSRAGRLELKTERVDMGGLVQAVLRNLRASLGDRSIKFDVAALPVAQGDAAMLERVWQNLLDNAIKYTGPKPDARVEVGAKPGEDETTYFVRDNGVGFDMQYADKLWGVFQRLHGAEFPGSGIGLAIVKRIVTRHGGHVWAEGKVGEGAAFYFSLPTKGRVHE